MEKTENLLVSIELVDQFDLQLHNDTLILPEIYVTPQNLKRRPLQPRVELHITGAPVALQEAIRRAYGEVQLPNKKLNAEYHIKPNPIPFPPQAVITKDEEVVLEVVCHYQEPDASGNPGEDGSCSKRCRLMASRDVWPRRHLSVRPVPLGIIDGEKAAILKIVDRTDPLFTDQVPKSQCPQLELIEPEQWVSEWRLPELEKQLERIVTQTFDPVSAEDRYQQVYEIPFFVRLPASERQELKTASLERSLEIPVQAKAPWAKPVIFRLLIEPKLEQYPGQLAIDLGTSACSVTVCEPAEIRPRPLPADQERVLRVEFLHWLASNPEKALPGISEEEWTRFLKMVAETLGMDTRDPVTNVKNCFVPSPGDDDAAKVRMHEAIRRIELCLRKQEDKVRYAGSQRLHQIYSKAFSTFPFDGLNLITLPLDSRARGEMHIVSEMEILDLHPVRAVMGKTAAENRRQALMQSDPQQALSDRKIISQNRFLQSPKEYLELIGRDQPELVLKFRDSHIERLVPREIIKIAWEKLLDLFNEYRSLHPHTFSKGPVREAVVTFPTTLLPEPRKEIPRLLQELGIVDVKMKYDEAVSAAIFYLQLAFGGSTDVGPEAFKVRCHRRGDLWTHHLLILDIGGGTTDTALIRIEMTDHGARGGAGAGGRFYEITPTLLGSSGNANLGGDQITLKIFRVLKLALADCLLQFAGQNLAEARAYQPGRLLQILDADLFQPEFKQALEIAETILPTQFSDVPSDLQDAAQRKANKVQLFSKLWDLAEEIKKELGKHRLGEPEIYYHITSQQISDLTRHTDHPLAGAEQEADVLKLSSAQLRKVAAPVIRRALRIARGVVEKGFQRSQEDEAVPANSPGRETCQLLDRLILSGRSSNLGLVRDLIESEMLLCPHYAEGGTEIVFEPEYAKQATSVGASRAENLWGAAVASGGYDEHLRAGINQMHINIQNLFYFLPCSFYLHDQSNRLIDQVFSAHDRLRQLDDTPYGKIRSPHWRPPQPRGDIHRVDYEGDPGRHWGTLNLGSLARQLDRDVEELAEKLRARYEITHDLQVQVLLCNGDKPSYALPDANERVNILEKLDDLQTLQDKLEFDVVVNTEERGQGHTLFTAGLSFDHIAHRTHDSGNGRGEVLKFLYDPNPMPSPPKKGVYVFHRRFPGETNLKRLGSLPMPDLRGRFDFEYTLHAVLDQDGWLQLIVGEPPFWTTQDPREWIEQSGCVLIYRLEQSRRGRNPYQDPFSGVH
jgi:hypothetical protein